MLLLLYPISRVLLEIIRTDNPHDVAGLTVSQFISVAMFAFAVAYLFIIYKFMPERSPYADAARAREPALVGGARSRYPGHVRHIQGVAVRAFITYQLNPPAGPGRRCGRGSH